MPGNQLHSYADVQGMGSSHYVELCPPVNLRLNKLFLLQVDPCLHLITTMRILSIIEVWGKNMRGNIFKKYCGVLQSCHWFLARDIIMRLWKPTPIASCCQSLGLSLCFREAVGWWESSWIQLFPTTWPFFQLVGSGYSELYLFSRFSVWTFGIWWSFIFYLFTSFVVF